MWGSSNKGYKKFGGKTYEREATGRKKAMKEKGEDLKSSWLSSVSSYRVVKEGRKYALYVR